MVSFNRNLFDVGADLLDVAEGSRAADAELAAHVAEGHRRRREAQRPLVAAWATDGALRPGLSLGEAGDMLWAFTSPELFRLLAGAGWTGDRYERHLNEVLSTALFGPGA